MSKSAGRTIVAFMQSLRIRSNEDNLEIAIHFLWQPYGVMHFIGVERLSKSRQVETQGPSVFSVWSSHEKNLFSWRRFVCEGFLAPFLLEQGGPSHWYELMN